MASIETVPEIVVATAAEFRARIKSAYQDGGVKAPRKVQYLGSFSDGSRYLVEDGVRAISFYLVQNLTAPAKAPAGHRHAFSDMYSNAQILGGSTTSTVYAQIASTAALSTPADVNALLMNVFGIFSFEARVSAGNGTVSLAENQFGIGTPISREVVVTSVTNMTVTLIGAIAFGPPLVNETLLLQGKVDLGIHTLTIGTIDSIFILYVSDKETG